METILDLGKLRIGIEVDTTKIKQYVTDALKEIEKFNDQVGDKLQKASDSMVKAGKTMSATVTAPIVGFGAAISKISIDFEKQMSSVQAISGASAEELKQLEEAARKAGATTKFSATEAAQGLEYMALAGYSVSDSIETLPKLLSLATAGNLDLAYASDLVTDIGSALNLTLDDTDELLDKMAKSASSSNMSVAQAGEAMLTVGGTALTLSGGLTEVNTALGILANNGVKGSEGGVALRNTILSLTAPTDKARDAMESLGIQISDAEGNMLPLDNIMKQFNTSLIGLGKVEKQEILNSIFNKVDLKSISALMASTVMNIDDLKESLSAMGVDVEANVDCLNYLAGTFELNEDKAEFCNYAMQEMDITMEQATLIYEELNKAVAEGSSAWSDLANKIEDSEGACDKMAEIMNDNLDGTLKTIGSATEELALQFGEILLPVLKKVAVGILKLIEFLQKIDSNTKTVIAVVASVMAVLPPLLLIGGKLIQGIIKLKGWITLLSTSITEMGGIMALLTNPVTIAIAAITALATTVIYLYNTNDEVKEALDACWESIKELFANACELIKAIVEAFVDVFKALWDRYGTYIKESIREVWDVVEKVFETAFKVIKDIFDIFASLFKGDWEGLWESVKTLASDVWNGIVGLVEEMLEVIITTLVNFGGSIFLAAIELFENVKRGFSETWDKIMNWFEGAKQDPVNAIKSVGSAMYNAGVNILTSLWDGLKSTWTKISSWFTDKVEWIKNKFNVFSSQADAIANRKVDGSHRNGIKSVPYDSYYAELHKGERVLTSNEAKRYEQQQDQQQTFVSNIVDTSRMESLLEKMNRTLDRLPQNLQTERRMGFA